MIIGAPVEIKPNEKKIALTPAMVNSLVSCGHKVIVQKNIGETADFPNDSYIRNGACLVDTPEEVYSQSDIIVKLNQPQIEEYGLLREKQIIFAFFKYSEKDNLMQTVLDKKITTIDYSAIRNNKGNYPIVRIGSEIVGKTLIRIASSIIEKYKGGSLIGGATGVAPMNITIIGAGTVGFDAAKTAVALGADVSILDIEPEKLRKIEKLPGRKIRTLFSNSDNLDTLLPQTDILICAVKRNNKKLPPIIHVDDVRKMKRGSVIIDAGLASNNIVVETLDRVMPIENPVFEKEGVYHFCYRDIASLSAKTISSAISGVLIPYVLAFANEPDIVDALKECPDVANGVMTFDGNITNEIIAEQFGEHVYELSMITGF
ncbi:MAG: alanine dehydrogenase [Candidatus Gastranaerophilaceae bacterium]